MGDLDFLQLNPEAEKGPDATVLPAGIYTVAIADAVLKNTKDLTGKYVSMELTVLDGEHAKRKVWDIINIKNKNDQATLIGRQTLAALAGADAEAVYRSVLRERGELLAAILHRDPTQWVFAAGWLRRLMEFV